jgi:hypothetical protein
LYEVTACGYGEGVWKGLRLTDAERLRTGRQEEDQGYDYGFFRPVFW